MAKFIFIYDKTNGRDVILNTANIHHLIGKFTKYHEKNGDSETFYKTFDNMTISLQNGITFEACLKDDICIKSNEDLTDYLNNL